MLNWAREELRVNYRRERNVALKFRITATTLNGNNQNLTTENQDLRKNCDMRGGKTRKCRENRT